MNKDLKESVREKGTVYRFLLLLVRVCWGLATGNSMLGGKQKQPVMILNSVKVLKYSRRETSVGSVNMSNKMW